ncbi:hypothetical protein RFI_05367, partial [Reticulomyxa filosa]
MKEVKDSKHLPEEESSEGHINITSVEDGGMMVMSEEALEASKRHEQMLEQMRQKRLKMNLNVPTDDEEVKARLRALQEPVCYFGEEASDRRDRLREIMAQYLSQSKPLPEFRKNRKQLQTDLKKLSETINKNRPYFSQGLPVLKAVRTKILKYSMRNAKLRVEAQRRQRENPLPLSKAREQHEELIQSLKQHSVQSSELACDRPLTVCKISPQGLFDKHPCNDHKHKFLVALGCMGGRVELWDEFGTKHKSILCHSERITGIAWCPKVKLQQLPIFVTASADQ